MEWRTGRSSDIQSVIVPDEFAAAIVELLQGTGIALDPYEDRTIGTGSTQEVSEVLKQACAVLRTETEDLLMRELGVSTLPVWTGEMLSARLGQNRWLTTCAALVTLCEFALAQNIDLEILGQ